mgnify:CR=1 FL=1
METKILTGGSSPAALKEKKAQIKYNLPYSLEVWWGTDYSGDRSVAGDERERVLIGSEIEPIEIGVFEEDYIGNGSFSKCFYYLIQQDGKILLVEQWVEYHTYGYSIQQEDWEFKVYELPVAEGFKLNESLSKS